MSFTAVLISCNTRVFDDAAKLRNGQEKAYLFRHEAILGVVRTSSRIESYAS